MAPENAQLQHSHNGDRQGLGQLVYQRLRAVDTPPGWKSPIRFFDTVVGTQFGQIETQGFEGPGPGVSPALPVMSSQELIEAILRDAADVTGMVDLRFGHQVTEVVSGWRDVRRRGRRAGAGGKDRRGVHPVRARRWSRRTASRAWSETSSASRWKANRASTTSSTVTSGPTSRPTWADRKGVLLFVANPGSRRVLQPLDARGRWLCQIAVQPDQWRREAWDADRVQQWVRGAVGVPDLEVEVRSVGLWRMNVTVAERLVAGRVVLCGDAAHQFPPTGGLGVNTGLQGMHNAMWKLALCVHGVANWSLLETYNAERRAPGAAHGPPVIGKPPQRRAHRRCSLQPLGQRHGNQRNHQGVTPLRQPPRRRVRHEIRIRGGDSRRLRTARRRGHLFRLRTQRDAWLPCAPRVVGQRHRTSVDAGPFRRRVHRAHWPGRRRLAKGGLRSLPNAARADRRVHDRRAGFGRLRNVFFDQYGISRRRCSARPPRRVRRLA